MKFYKRHVIGLSRLGRPVNGDIPMLNNFRPSLRARNWLGSKQSIDVKVYPKTYREEKLDYIYGRKWDKDKEEAVKLNKEWRLKNAL